MKIVETRRICSDDVRILCVDCNLYTNGDYQEYAKLLSHAGNITNVTAEDLLYIAIDIKKHSFTDRTIENICYELARKCFSTFEITD